MQQIKDLECDIERQLRKGQGQGAANDMEEIGKLEYELEGLELDNGDKEAF